MADLKTLLSDKDFMKSIVEMETPEEVQKAFKDKGVELSKEQVQEIGEIINATLEKGSTLSESELEEISGGDKGFVDGLMSPFNGFSGDSLSEIAGLFVTLGGVAVVSSTVASGVLVGITKGITKIVTWAKNRKKH